MPELPCPSLPVRVPQIPPTTHSSLLIRCHYCHRTGHGGSGLNDNYQGSLGAVMQEEKSSRHLGICSGGQQVGDPMLGWAWPSSLHQASCGQGLGLLQASPLLILRLPILSWYSGLKPEPTGCVGHSLLQKQSMCSSWVCPGYGLHVGLLSGQR